MLPRNMFVPGIVISRWFLELVISQLSETCLLHEDASLQPHLQLLLLLDNSPCFPSKTDTQLHLLVHHVMPSQSLAREERCGVLNPFTSI